MIESIELDIQTLIKIQNNLKKSINKKFKKETLQSKRQYILALFNDIETNLIENEQYISETKLNFYIKASREAVSEIKQIIDKKLNEHSRSKNSDFSANRNSENMPTVDIKLGTSLVNTYDGSPGQLSAFIDAVELFSDTVDTTFNGASAAEKATAQATVVRFIKTRLTGTARQAVGDLNDLPQIIDSIKRRCSPKITSDNILAKLKTTKQHSTAESFCDAVEKLTNDLRSAYLTERIPPETAEKMATKRGVETLINGTKNQDTKLILKAGNFDNFNDAVQKLQENETADTSRPHIFHVRGHANHRGRGRGYSSRGNRPRGRVTYNNSGRYNSNQNFNQYNNNNYRNGNNNNWRGRNYQQFNPRSQGPGRQIFYNSQGNDQVPQQQTGGIVTMNPPIQPQNQINQPVQLAQIAHRQ